MSDGKNVAILPYESEKGRLLLTFVHGSVFKYQLINELQPLLFRRILQFRQQMIISEVKLRGTRHTMGCFPILNPTVSIVAIVASEPLLFPRKKEKFTTNCVSIYFKCARKCLLYDREGPLS